MYSKMVKRKTFLHLSSAALVHPDNQMLGFLAYSPVDALGAMELPHGEFLLVFNTLGVYVDMQGRKSRDREIMYPAVPTVRESLTLLSTGFAPRSAIVLGRFPFGI